MNLRDLGSIYSLEDIKNAYEKGQENSTDFKTFFEETYCSEKKVTNKDFDSEIAYMCDGDYIPELKVIFDDENIKPKILDIFKHFYTTFEFRRTAINFNKIK